MFTNDIIKIYLIKLNDMISLCYLPVCQIYILCVKLLFGKNIPYMIFLYLTNYHCFFTVKDCI